MPFRASRPRFVIPAVALVAGVTLFAGRGVRAAGTQYNVISGQTNLTLQGTYTTGGTSGTGAGGTAAAAAPTVTSDVLFDSGVTYANPTAFVIPTNVTFGSLNDLSATAITISNTGGTAASTLTLGGAGSQGDGVVGSAAGDLLFVGTGATLNITGGTGVTALNLALGQSGNFDVAGTSTISSIISGGFGLTKTGAGTLTLGGVNTYSGGTTVNAGILQYTNIGTVNGTNSGAFTLGGGTLQINQAANNFAYNPVITLTADSTFSNIGAGAINYAGVLNGGGHALNINTGAARLFINTTAANLTNVSQFNVTAGALGFDTSGGSGGGTPVVVSNGASLLYFNGTNNAVSATNNVTLNGGAGFGGVGALNLQSGGGTGTVTLSGTVALNSTSSVGVAANTLILSGNVTGGGGLTKILTGTLTLSGGANSYSGGTIISAGNLIAQNSANTNVDLALGTGTVNLSGGTLLLKANGTGSNQTIITGNGTTGSNVTVGSDATIDVNNLSANTGSTFVLNNLSIGANTLSVTGANGYSLRFAGATTLTGNAAFSGAANLANLNLAGPVGDGGGGFNLTKNGLNTLTLSGANTYTGGTTVNAGVLEFTQTVAMPSTGVTMANAGGTLAVAVGGAGQFAATGTGAGTLAGVFAGVGVGTSTVTLNAGSSVGVDTGSGSVTYATPITNAGVGLNKLGANSLILTAAETYTGPTTITAGTLQLGNGTAGNNGSLATPTIFNGGALIFAPATGTTITSSATIGGGGTLTVNGTGGTVNLAGVGTFTGATTVTAGTLDLQNSLALQNSALAVPAAGSLVFDSAVASNAFTVGALNGANNLALQNNAPTPAGITLTIGNLNNLSSAYSGVLSGPGGLSTFGLQNTLTLTGANTYTGATTIGGGILNLGGAGANGSIGTGGVGGALVLGGAGGGTFAFTRTNTNTQTFTSTAVNSGQNAVTESLNTQTVGLGTITNGVGGTLDVSSVGVVTTSNTLNTNGILGGYATFGNRSTFAVAPATSGGAITGLGAYTTSATAGTAPANFLNQNIDVTAATTPTGAITPNSLRFNTATALTVTLASNSVNTIVSGGILDTPTATATSTITGGFLTAGGNQLSLVSPVGGLTVSSQLVDNGTTPLAVAATGPAGTTLAVSFQNANNSYTGGTFLNGGRFGFASGGTPFGTGTLTFGDQVTSGSNGGGLQIGGQNFTTGLLAMPLGNNSSNGDIGANNGLNVITLQGTGTATFNGTFGTLAAGAGARETTVVLNSGTEIFGALSNAGTFNGIGRGNGTGQTTGGFVVNGGTFQLGNGFSGTVTDEGTSVTVGGGTFAEVGNVAGFYNQTFTGGIIVNTGASAVTVNSNGGAGTVFNPGPLTRTVGGGTVNFTLPTAQAGAQNATNGITTTTLNTNGILGGYATVGGTDWATNATNTAGGNIIGLSASTINGYTADTFNGTANADVTTSGFGGSANSLRFNTAGANTLTFSSTNSIASGGILVTANVGSANATTLTGGTLTGSAQDLVVIQNNPTATGALTISSTLGSNGSSGLTKSGPGMLILAPDPNGGGANFFTGALTINGGIVNLTQDGLGLASSIVLNGGIFQANGAINGQTEAPTPVNIGVVVGINGGRISTVAGNVTLPGNVTNAAGNQFLGAGAFGGFNSTGIGALTVGGGGILTLSGTGNSFGGGLVIANGTVVDAAPSGVGTLGTGYVTFGAANTPTVDLNGHSATVAGLIGTGTNGLITNNATTAGTSTLTLNGVSNQSFAGTVQNGPTGTVALTLALNNPLAAQTLTGANTYSGGTVVNVGTLLVSNTTGSGTGTGAVTVGNGTTLAGRLGGTGTIGGAVTVNAGSAVTGGTFGGVGILTMTSTLNLNGAYSVDLGTLGSSDRLVLSATGVNGILAFGSGASLAFTGTPDGSAYTLATYASDTGFASLVANSTLPAGYSLSDTGTALRLTAVPEPSTWVSGLFGALALLGTSLFRRHRRAACRTTR